jgi:error-prone DNA polymerase
VLADYQTIRLSLKAYPTQFLRPGFDAEGIARCKDVGDKHADGEWVRCAGVVLVRQRPGQGNAIFITLSDETGICNVVIWARTFEKFRREVMGSRLLLVEGKVQQSPEGVVHLMAERLIDRSADLSLLADRDLPMPTPTHRHPRNGHPRNVRVLPQSRDFH